MSGRVIDKQRCFQIPKAKLDLFLVQLFMLSGDHIQLEAEYIFDNLHYYDVVVNHYGSYPFIENKLETFVKDLREV